MRGIISLLVLCAVAPSSAHAEKIKIDDDTFLNVVLLIQPQLVATQEGAPNDNHSTDFFLRRGRIVLSGQIDPKLSFVFITDQANWGRNGDYSAAFIIQDALGSYKFGPWLTLDAGFMLLPFIRNDFQSAGALNTIDYRTPVIRFPTARAFRDMGVMARGLLANNKISYRAGIFNGIAGRAETMTLPEVNRGDAPRVTANVRYNIMGKEEGYAWPGIYFAKEPIVNVGVGLDWQHRGIGGRLGDVDTAQRYLAYAVDAFVDYPLDVDNEIVAQAAIIKYDHYADPSPSPTDSAFAWYLEGGYRYRQVEPVIAIEYFNGTAAGTKLTTFRIGVNAWISKHAYNVKFELAIPRLEQIEGAPEVQNDLVGTVQLQTQF